MQNENQDIKNIPEYDFDIIEIMKEGFRRIEGVKRIFLAAFVVYVVVAIIVQMILGIFFPSSPSPAQPYLLNQQIVTILSYPVLMPIIAGVIMLAIHYSRGESIEFNSIIQNPIE